MLLAAVQYLLLGGVEHELSEHYPVLAGGAEPKTPAFPKFRDFCLTHRDAILRLVRTRWIQTCVVRRCVCLLPAFARISSDTGQPLALLEVGPGAGLNLLWDRYRYDYRGGPEWGDPRSELLLDTEKRGSTPLPELLAQAPRDAALVVFATMTLYQFPPDAVRSFFKLLVTHGEKRPLLFLSMEGNSAGGVELQLTHYVGGERDTRKLADCNGHAHWIKWAES